MSAGRRWAKEAKTYDCVEGDALIQMPSGEVMIDVKVSVDDETWARMKLGYICANCFEPQETPFPERCTALKLPDGKLGCGYPMRKQQLLDMAERPGAGENVHIGSRINRTDEIERMRQMDEFEQRTGIIIPSKEKFPMELHPGRRR
jgi:hypothetical protein